MSRAAFAFDTDAAKSSSARQTGNVRVSHPGDSFELEADRVADIVSRGGRISNWSLASSGFDGIQRQTESSPSPAEIAGKVAEALLATPDGKQAVAAVTAVAGSPAGLVVTGTTAVGVIAALAKAKQPLPAQAPAIPLDVLHPGLSVKIAYQGPVNQPTGASITFSYTPKSPESKPAQSASEKLRAENATMAAEQAKFRAGLHPQDAQGPVQTPEQQMFDKWSNDKLAAIGNFARPGSAAAGANLSASKSAEKKPDIKAGPAAVPTPIHPISGTEKKEEIPIQRKADSSAPVTTGSADVDSVLRSSGRPLDPSTRREMESRIGFDFSSVRLHTDARAANSAQLLSAHAYTVESNVVFAPGRYAPQTGEGRRLLAHELTHVVQQTASPQRAHPAVRPAPRQVQRAWSGKDIPGVSWLLDKLKGLKGYPLFCVIIGKGDLIDDVEVERNATTLTQGILNLFPGGSELFEKLKKAAGALQSAYHWLVREVDNLGFRRKNTSPIFWEAGMGGHQHMASRRLVGADQGNLQRAVRQTCLAGLQNRLQGAGLCLRGRAGCLPRGEKGLRIPEESRHGDLQYHRRPHNFAKNLFAAVQKGFTDFGLNILTHLGNGLKAWIFDELAIKGVTMPTESSFASHAEAILQVLGLTYQQRRPQLVEKLGETAVTFFETSVKIFERIRTEGFSAIWEMIKEKASSIFDSLIDGIKNWVIQEIVKRGLLMVAALASPIGDFIEVVTSIYEVIVFIVEKARKLADLVETVVDVGRIVAGNIGPAAKKVEDSLARTIPLLLVLCRPSPSDRHRRIHPQDCRRRAGPYRRSHRQGAGHHRGKCQTPVEAGKAAFTQELDAIKNWWSKPKKFHWGTEEHEVNVEGDGEHPEVFVHSAEKTPLKQFLKDVKATPAQTKKIVGLADKLGWRQGELQKPADDAAGAKTYDDLTFELDHLKARDAYPSRLVKPQTTHPKLGTGMEADVFLSANRGLGTDTQPRPGPCGLDGLGVLAGQEVLPARPPVEQPPGWARGMGEHDADHQYGEWANECQSGSSSERRRLPTQTAPTTTSSGPVTKMSLCRTPIRGSRTTRTRSGGPTRRRRG